jgi:hypothetical protein
MLGNHIGQHGLGIRRVVLPVSTASIMRNIIYVDAIRIDKNMAESPGAGMTLREKKVRAGCEGDLGPA